MILKHKDISIADVNVENGVILSVNAIYNKEHYPIGAYSPYKELQTALLKKWSETRVIPYNRQNAEKISKLIGCTLIEASFKNMGIGLTDCYWFTSNENLKWKDVNYYGNGFSSSLTSACLFKKNTTIEFNTPDFVTDGVLEKYWIFKHRVPILLKLGNFGNMANDKNVLSANEIIASQIANKIGIPCVGYFMVKNASDNQMLCGCQSFINNENEEFVSAEQIIKEMKGKRIDVVQYYKDRNIGQSISDMLFFDALIGNTDRHTKNFGIIRDADTLEIKRAAPLYDNGSCLGWNGEPNIEKIPVKPFADSVIEQFKFINAKYNIPDIDEIIDVIKTEYKQFEIDGASLEMAINTVMQNVQRLEREGIINIAHEKIKSSEEQEH